MPPPAEGFAARLILGPALRTQPDRRLVTLVREGYETAFEEIVRRYGKPLTRYAASIVGGRSEDVAQDAFFKALVALRRNDAEIDLRPWLFRIVRNTALNDLRDSPPSPEVLAEAIAGGGNPAEELERREELADLIERLRALPEPQRAAIVMRELEGLGHDKIAAALGLSGGAARQAIYRARRALRGGAGMLLPLPLLKAILEGTGPGAAETVAGAAGVGGAGVALKATAATVLVAGAVGAGVALDHGARTGTAEAIAPPSRSSSRGAVTHSRSGEASGGEIKPAAGRGSHRSRSESGGISHNGQQKDGGGPSAADGGGRPDSGSQGGGRGGDAGRPSHSGSSGLDGGDSGKGSDGNDLGGGGGESGGHSGHGDGSGSDGGGFAHDEPGSIDDTSAQSGPESGDGDTGKPLSGGGSDGSGDAEGPGGPGTSREGIEGEPNSGTPGSDDSSRDSHGGDGLTD
jgi:RNA polymerase sigma factor (sigma-70 family)